MSVGACFDRGGAGKLIFNEVIILHQVTRLAMLACTAPAAVLQCKFCSAQGCPVVFAWESSVACMGVKRRLRGKQPQSCQQWQSFLSVANKPKRSLVHKRVQFYGVRVSCAVEKYFELQAMLEQERRKK